MNILTHVYFGTPVFNYFGYIPGSGIAGSCDNSMIDLLTNEQTVPYYIPTINAQGSNFYPSPPTLVIF